MHPWPLEHLPFLITAPQLVVCQAVHIVQTVQCGYNLRRLAAQAVQGNPCQGPPPIHVAEHLWCASCTCISCARAAPYGLGCRGRQAHRGVLPVAQQQHGAPVPEDMTPGYSLEGGLTGGRAHTSQILYSHGASSMVGSSQGCCTPPCHQKTRPAREKRYTYALSITQILIAGPCLKVAHKFNQGFSKRCHRKKKRGDGAIIGMRHKGRWRWL